MKKQLAIFLCLALLLSSVVSIGLTSLAENAEKVVFENDFSEMTYSVPTGMHALTPTSKHAYEENGPADGKWISRKTADPGNGQWIYAIGLYGSDYDLVAGGNYTVSFDYEIVSMFENHTKEAFRLFITKTPSSYTEVASTLKYYDIIEQHTLEAGQKGTCTVSVEDFTTHSTAFEDTDSICFFLATKAVSELHIDNIVITETVADSETPVTKFSTDFPGEIKTTGMHALTPTSKHAYEENGPVDGKWISRKTADPGNGQWIYAIGLYGSDYDLVAGGNYTVSFDYEIVSMFEDHKKEAFRLFITKTPSSYTEVASTLKYYDIIEQHTLEAGQKGTCTVSVEDFTTHSTDFEDTDSICFFLATKAVSELHIDNIKIIDLTPSDEPDQPVEPDVPVEPEQPEEPTETVLLETDFSTMPEALRPYTADETAKYYSSLELVDGALKGSAPINAGDWSNMFRTDATKLPLVWETAGNNVYKIEFDWALPEGTNEDDTAEMRVLITSADGKTRGDQVTLYKKMQAAGTSGHFEQTIQFNGVARVKNQAFAADGAHNMELIFIAKYTPAVIIDNLKITDLSPAGEPEQPEDPVLPDQPDEPVGTETVILDTDFSTDSVDGLLALGGGVAKYYGNFDGDINGIVDGEWKSFKANYADDTASKKQWYSAWGTHTTDNPIIWGKNFAYRVEFDWSIPGACENAQFRLIMESAHTKTPALNDNGDFRPYQVGIYNTDGTYSDPGYVITQTDASSGSFKATFAVNNLNLPDNNTPVDGTVMRILIRSQLETFTIDNLKITRVAIEPDVKEEEPEEPPVDESNTKVLLETDFTSVPMGLGNTWGGAYEFVGVNDELDVWEADAENTPGGWKMICNTVYNVVPIVWGEGHSYKIEVSYSLPKGSGDAGRFELVLDKDDGTQDHRGMQTTVFNATKGAIEAGDTVYTYETVFVTAGQAAKGELNTDDHMMLKFMAKTLPAIYLHSVKITDLNAALTPEIDLPELDDSEEEQTQPINVWVKLTNADAAPIANQFFKLDVGEMLQFDANGCYKFENVLSGAYTINLLDADGNVLTSAYYTILAGETTDIFGNFATIDKSVTDLYITLEYAKGKLTVKDMSVDADAFGPAGDGDDDDDNVVLDPDDSTDSPDTGDTLPMVAAAAVLLAGIAVIVSKKNRVNG